MPLGYSRFTLPPSRDCWPVHRLPFSERESMPNNVDGITPNNSESDRQWRANSSLTASRKRGDGPWSAAVAAKVVPFSSVAWLAKAVGRPPNRHAGVPDRSVGATCHKKFGNHILDSSEKLSFREITLGVQRQCVRIITSSPDNLYLRNLYLHLEPVKQRAYYYHLASSRVLDKRTVFWHDPLEQTPLMRAKRRCCATA
jgi:hypothetical protein